MQHNCRSIAIVLSLMLTASLIFLVFGFILAFLFSVGVIAFYINYLRETKRKQTEFLKAIASKYKMDVVITSENVDKNMDLVPQKLKDNLFHINWIGFDYLREKPDKIIMSDYFLESKSNSPKFIFSGIGYFVSRQKGADHHSAIISYIMDEELNLPRFVIFPNYRGILTTLKGNLAKKNYSQKYNHAVPDSEIPGEFSKFEMFTDAPEFTNAILNSEILPALAQIDAMKKEFSATLICDGNEVFLATDGWIYTTDRMAVFIELSFLMRNTLKSLRR